MVLALAALKQKIWPTMYCLTAGRDSRLLLGYVIATEGPGHTEPHHSCLQIFAIGAAQPRWCARSGRARASRTRPCVRRQRTQQAPR